MLRYFILLLIVFIMGFIGMMACYCLTTRRRELEWFQRALFLLETEMDFSRDPLHVALEQTGKRTGGKVASIFCRASILLQEAPSVSGEQAFLAALEEARDELPLNDEDIAVIKRIGCDLGITDLEDQKKKIALCAKAIEVRLESACNSEKKWQRICSVGGWMTGIIFALILI